MWFQRHFINLPKHLKIDLNIYAAEIVQTQSVDLNLHFSQINCTVFTFIYHRCGWIKSTWFHNISLHKFTSHCLEIHRKEVVTPSVRLFRLNTQVINNVTVNLFVQRLQFFVFFLCVAIKTTTTQNNTKLTMIKRLVCQWTIQTHWTDKN